MAIPPKNIPQTTIPPGSTEYIVSYLDAERQLKDSPVSMMGVSRLVENYVVCRDHTYQWHVVILIRKGELIFRNDEEKNPEIRKFDAGTLLFLPAHSLYTYGTDHELQITWFHLNAESSVWHFLRGIGIFYDRSDDKEGFRSLIMLLYREYTLAQKPDTNISYLADQLIAHMLERKLKIFVTETESARNRRIISRQRVDDPQDGQVVQHQPIRAVFAFPAIFRPVPHGAPQCAADDRRRQSAEQFRPQTGRDRRHGGAWLRFFPVARVQAFLRRLSQRIQTANDLMS